MCIRDSRYVVNPFRFTGAVITSMSDGIHSDYDKGETLDMLKVRHKTPWLTTVTVEEIHAMIIKYQTSLQTPFEEITEHKLDVYKRQAQEACGILFKDKKKLPSCFRLDGKNGRSKTPVYRFDMSDYYGNRNIEYLIGIVRILPKSYLKGIDGSDDSNGN